MIKLKKLNKYYNRSTANEIHVINDINLELPNKGLVVLLGPSGSGKTTLLNVLGGLDKVQNGTIQFDDQEINRYSSATWDKIRNKKVGYIFQNYNLLEKLTVYDNISLTLNMVGIYDKNEIDKRIEYILDSMGMINYRKRRASQLSGGQQQRVAIARALAKNPQVIIADEPTGNLDSKNTQDIMNIIKNISRTKLVVLVTHEENIANFYGDRIIRLIDGKIVSDIVNVETGSLDVQHDTDIYLGDMKNTTNTLTDNGSFRVYTDEDIDDNMDIRLIVKNKTIYVEVKSTEYKKMQLLDSGSEINIFDKKYEKLQKESFIQNDFDLDRIADDSNAITTRHSVISIKDSLRLTINRLRGSSRLGKLFYIGFILVSVLIALAVGMLSGILTSTSDEFLSGAKEIVYIDMADQDYAALLAHVDDPSIDYLEIVQDTTFNVKLPTIFQSYSSNNTRRREVAISDFMDTSKIIIGRTVEDYNEVVLNKQVADALLKSNEYRYLGITTYEDLLKVQLSVNLPGLKYEVTIVGIIDDESPVMYMKKELIYMSQFHVGLFEVFEDDITKDAGFDVADDDEIWHIASDDLVSPLALNRFDILEEEFKVVGTYTSTEDVPDYLVTMQQLEDIYFAKTFTESYHSIRYYSNDIDKTLAYFKNLGIEAESTYEEQLAAYRLQRLNGSIGTIVFASVVLGASAISYFFVIRSSLLSRIYEISVYRALGVTKGDIVKIFLTEIVLITTITSLIGYLATTAILYRVQILAADFMDTIQITPLSVVAGILAIYAANIISGLIPVSNLLRKTPAEILSKYDF